MYVFASRPVGKRKHTIGSEVRSRDHPALRWSVPLQIIFCKILFSGFIFKYICICVYMYNEALFIITISFSNIQNEVFWYYKYLFFWNINIVNWTLSPFSYQNVANIELLRLVIITSIQTRATQTQAAMSSCRDHTSVLCSWRHRLCLQRGRDQTGVCRSLAPVSNR